MTDPRKSTDLQHCAGFSATQTCLLNSRRAPERFRIGRQLAELNQIAEQRKAIYCGAGRKWHAALLKDSAADRKAPAQICPPSSYPDLPVSARADEIAELICKHQVIVVAGETGSGKTTQLPKICLQAGRGVKGMIGHTQPRRIAARTVANRIAEEAQVHWAARRLSGALFRSEFAQQLLSN